jgi:hypothetical protein
MVASGVSLVAETRTLVDDGGEVAGRGLSASFNSLGIACSMKTVRPPSTILVMPPSNAETCTMPWITWTALRCWSTTTVKVVPLTTAASIGVSTAKCGIPVCWTLNSRVPRVWITRVKPLDCGVEGSFSWLRGATRI